MWKVQERFPLDAAGTVSPPGPATITVITTDESLLETLWGILQADRYRLEPRPRPEPLSSFLSDRRSDAVLLDLRWLPVSTRIEIGRQVREVRRRPTIPLIGICDDRLSYEGRTTALGDGFWDVVELPGQSAELAAKLGTWIWLKKEVDGIQSGMLLDIKTGHYTALGCKRRLRELVALARRTNDPLCCIVFGADVSLDEARVPTDTLYDLELKFSLALHHGTRSSDVVGHLGFLKFLVLAPHTPLSGGLRMAERFTSLSLSRRVDGDFPVTLSAGVAGIDGRNGQVQACPDLLLAAASRALNEARSAGTAQVAAAWGTT